MARRDVSLAPTDELIYLTEDNDCLLKADENMLELEHSDTNIEYYRAALGRAAAAASHLPEKLRSQFLHKQINSVIRAIKRGRSCALADLLWNERLLDQWTRSIGSLDRGSKALSIWLSANGDFDERFDFFFATLRFSSSHEAIAAHGRKDEVASVLKGACANRRYLEDLGWQLTHSKFAKEALREHGQLQRRLADGEKLCGETPERATRVLGHFFPGLDWKLPMIEPPGAGGD